ncbi:MAG: flagellar biosynthesis protein FlhF [Armatimonadota bacterium]
MRIKTFEAPNLREALDRAREELGEDAVILNTRHVRSPGLLGIGGSSKVELTAAASDEEWVHKPGEAVPSSCTPGGVRSSTAGQGVSMKKNVATAVDLSPSGSADAGRARLDNYSTGGTATEIADIKWELKRLGLIVENLLAPRMSAASEILQRTPESTPLLVRAGVDGEIASRQLSEIVGIEDPHKLVSALAMKLEEFASPPDLTDSRVIALVGPTGVGKTTTLAKLAARYSIEHRKSVALVTIDTYRIGAVEQLRTYARIMGIPLEIASTPGELARAIDRHSGCDLVLIDTVGRSHRNERHLLEVKSFLDTADGLETHLVVSASLSFGVMKEVAERFRMFAPVRLIITKLDEVQMCGALVNLPFMTSLPISCTTSGQNVPQDLEFADANVLARTVVARVYPEVAR